MAKTYIRRLKMQKASRFRPNSFKEKKLQKNSFTHRFFYTQMSLHTDALRTDAFTHKGFDTQRLDTQTRLQTDAPINAEGCAGRRQSAILPQFLTIEPHFVQKTEDVIIAMLLQFFTTKPDVVQKSCRGGCDNRTFTPVFHDKTSCRAKQLPRRMW